MTKIIGYTRDSYAERRNFLNLPFKNIIFKRKFDRYTFHRKFNQLKGRQDWKTQFSHKPIPFLDNDVDGYHFFNTISYSKKPYIVSFETSVPRWKDNITGGLDVLSRPNCKGIIAISDRAFTFQKKLIEHHCNHPEPLLSKLKKIPPAQNLFVDSNNFGKKLGKTLKIIFIGDLFFLKGGYELLLAVDELISLKYPLNLTIISKIETDDWFTHSNQELVQHVNTLIQKHSGHIDHFSSIPNDKVLNLLSTHDICALPSFAETYGYSLLEAMAFGCPIITTNTGAFNEINHSSRGWFIPLSQNKKGQAIINKSKSLSPFSMELLTGIKSVIKSIFQNKEMIYDKAINSVKYIEEYHDPKKIAKEYVELYERF